MKKIVLLIVVIFMVLMSTSIPSFARDEPIVLVENPWTASSLNVNVAKLILEERNGL